MENRMSSDHDGVWRVSKVSAIIINVAEMQAYRRDKCTERFFSKGSVGLTGNSDKVSYHISLCQDLLCGGNVIINDRRR